MNKDNNIYFLVLLITFFFNLFFNISNAFNPFGGNGQDMDQAMEDLLKEIQNLSPEDQQLLNDLGRQMEEEMISQGLDPSNPDDLFKWAEGNENQDHKKNETPATEKIHEQKQIEPERVQLINTPENAIKILDGIAEHLNLTREKAIFYPEINQKLENWSGELDQLGYLVNVLTQKDLVQHLISKQFESLYNNLEKLYIALNKYEPEIRIIKPEEETPYDILGIPYYSSQQQIEEKYKEFQEKYSDSYIKNLCKEKKIPERELNKKLKEAHLALSFIEDAYLKLKEPRERKQIDRILSQQIQDEKISYRISENAFNDIINNINRFVFSSKLIPEIKKLLEKYKPEELAKAQAQEAIEKKVFERSKQPIKISPSPNKSPQEKSGYDQFNKLMAQEKNKKIPYPSRPAVNAPPEKKTPGSKGNLEGKGKTTGNKGKGEEKKKEETDDKKKKAAEEKKKKLAEEKKKKAAEEKKKKDAEERKKEGELALAPVKEELKHINERLNQISALPDNALRQPEATGQATSEGPAGQQINMPTSEQAEQQVNVQENMEQHETTQAREVNESNQNNNQESTTPPNRTESRSTRIANTSSKNKSNTPKKKTKKKRNSTRKNKTKHKKKRIKRCNNREIAD